MNFEELIKEISSETGFRMGRLTEDVTWIKNYHDHSAIRRVRQADVQSILFRLHKKWEV